MTYAIPVIDLENVPLEAVRAGIEEWDHVKGRVADYLAAYGRPEQVAAWRDGTPYVADLAENSASR